VFTFFSETQIEEELRKNGTGSLEDGGLVVVEAARGWSCAPRLRRLRRWALTRCGAPRRGSAWCLRCRPAAVPSPSPALERCGAGLQVSRLRSASRRTAGAAPAARVGGAGAVLVQPSSLQEAGGALNQGAGRLARGGVVLLTAVRILGRQLAKVRALGEAG
jgi:hypothetical protein